MQKTTRKTVPINGSLVNQNRSPEHGEAIQPLVVARHLTTEEFAESLGMSAQTLRKRYSQTGSYFSVRPIKLPNRRLLWPADALQQLISAHH